MNESKKERRKYQRSKPSKYPGLITNSYEYKKTAYLHHMYGISMDDYKNMIIKQDGHCAICNHEKELQIDHDHKTGKVRGLLCRACNTAIGKFKDDITVLMNAIEYLRGK